MLCSWRCCIRRHACSRRAWSTRYARARERSVSRARPHTPHLVTVSGEAPVAAPPFPRLLLAAFLARSPSSFASFFIMASISRCSFSSSTELALPSTTPAVRAKPKIQTATREPF